MKEIFRPAQKPVKTETPYWAGIATAIGLLTGAWFAPRWLALVLLALSAGICVTALVSMAREAKK